jgi:hypothetical protein
VPSHTNFSCKSCVALHREELFGGAFSKDLPPTLLGPFDIGGSEQRRDDALAAVRFRSPKIYLYKTSFFLWPHFITRQLENAVSTGGSRGAKIDQIPTLFEKTEASAVLILLSVHKTYTRLHAHRNNESIILPFLNQK